MRRRVKALGFWTSLARVVGNMVGASSYLRAVLAAAVFVLWGLMGFESATVPADEVRDPERTIPRVTLLGTAVTASVYLLSALAVMGVIEAADLSVSIVPLADAATRMWGGWAGTVVAAAAALAGLGVLNGWVLMQGQMPLAPARDGLFPAAFGRRSRSVTPAFGLMLSSGLCTVLVAANYTRGLLGLFEFALLLATVTVLVPYAFTAAAQIVLIRREPERWGSPDAGRAIAASLLGLAFTGAAILSAGRAAVGWGAVSIALGVPLYWWSLRTGRTPVVLRSDA